MSGFEAVGDSGGTFERRTGFRFPVALAFMLAYWCALILLDAAADGFNIRLNNWRIDPSELWFDRAVWFGAWMAVTPLVLFVLGGAYPGRFGPTRTLATHLVCHPALIGLQVLIAASVFVAADPNPTVTIGEHAVRLFLTVTLGRDLHAYAALIAIFYAASLRKQRFEAEIRASRLSVESAELSRRLTDAKLESLHRELNPHILFNALNSIGTLVRAGETSRAIRMLASMSTLLRTYLKPTHEPLVPLQDELDLLDRYLDMERIRLEDRLSVSVAVDPSAIGALLPPLLLQPLVENAVKHGADRSAGSTRLHLDVTEAEGRLRIDVVNESDPPPRAAARRDGGRPGIGLENLRRRLELLFGTEAGLELELRPSGARVTAWMPHPAEPASASRGRQRVTREAG